MAKKTTAKVNKVTKETTAPKVAKKPAYECPRLVTLRVPNKLWINLDKFAKRQNTNRNRYVVEQLSKLA